MANQTTNLGLRKPEGSDYVSVLNDISGNMDIIDGEAGRIESSIAIVQNGTTASRNITAGQYVMSNGTLKVAPNAIANGASLSSLTTVSDGGMNELNRAIQIKTFSYTYANLASASTLTVSADDFELTVPTGYTLAGIVGYGTGNNNAYAYGALPDASGNVLAIKNTSTSSIGGTCRVVALFVKTKFFNELT